MGSDHFSFTVGRFNCFAFRGSNDFDCNVLLIQTEQHLVLVDTGVGSTESTSPALLMTGLQAAGFLPDAIDTVILSHADFDHIGGTIDENGNLAFPHARYVLSQEEWAFWSLKPERLHPGDNFDEEFRRSIYTLPPTRLSQLQGKLELIHPDAEIVPGIQMIASPGHTPGYSVVTVASNGERLIFIGDLIYDPKDIENPDWYSVFDYDQKSVIATRRRIFLQASAEQTLLMAYHLPFPGLGYVAPLGQGWRWLPYEPKKS